MENLIHFVRAVKRNTLKEKRISINSLFGSFTLEKYKACGNHEYHAASILHLLINYSLSEKSCFLQKRYREDMLLAEKRSMVPSSHGFFYKSARSLSDDFKRCFKSSVSQSQIQRIMDIFTKAGILYRKRIGRNDLSVHPSTYCYRINIRAIFSIFNIPFIPIEKIRDKVQKSVTPVFKIIKDIKLRFISKRRKTELKNMELGIYSQFKPSDLEKAVPDWREIAQSMGVRSAHIDDSQERFQDYWARHAWHRDCSATVLQGIWSRWCTNFVDSFQDGINARLARKRSSPSPYRILNEPSSSLDDSSLPSRPRLSLSSENDFRGDMPVPEEDREKVLSMFSQLIAELKSGVPNKT